MENMTHGKAYNAYLALNQIRNLVKGMDALHVFHMKNVLREAVDFMGEEEMRLVKEAGGTITETGMVIIEDNEKRKAYLAERKKLDDIPLQTVPEPISIRIDRCPDVTMEQIEMLDGFVIFEEEESDGDK